MLLGNCTANTSYRLFCPILVCNHCIHISLHDNNLLCLLHRILCLGHPIKHTLLLKQNSLGRVQVFRFPISQRPPTKSYHPSPYISNGKDDSLPKVIIDVLTFMSITYLAKAPLTKTCQASLYKLSLAIPLPKTSTR